MGRTPEIFRLDSDVVSFASAVKAMKTDRFARTHQSAQATKFWHSITINELVKLTNELAEAIEHYSDDIEGFKAWLAEYQEPNRHRNLDRWMLETSAEPLSNLVLEINSWRVPFAGELNVDGNPAAQRRSLGNNAIAVFPRKGLLPSKVEWVRV